MSSSSSHSSGSIQLWGQLEVDLLASSDTHQCQHYYTLENPLLVEALGVNAFNCPLTSQVSYVFPPALVSQVLLRFLTEHITGEFRLLILVVPCWMETSLSSHSF